MKNEMQTMRKSRKGVFRKAISLLLVLFTILQLVPVAFAATDDPGHRTVYLHARGEEPQDSATVTTVYKGDDVDVYFAVDNPNKSPIENNEYKNPHHNLNGYTVKIYFDPAYLDFATTSKTSPALPIDYAVPSELYGATGGSSGDGTGNDNVGDDPNNPDDAVNTPDKIGYYVYKLGSDSVVKGGRMYKVAYATIFFSGAFLPDKETDQLWYNLCKLPLKTLNKTGSTDVFLEIGTADEFALELFAKDHDDNPPTFTFSAIEGGRHHITIKDKYKPEPPFANPVSGSYTEAQDVTLTAESDCDIFYSTDGGQTYTKYTTPIPVNQSTKIDCYAQRKNDETKQSSVVSFEYKIIPKPPFLFPSDTVGGAPISNVYSQNQAFRVYPSDGDTYKEIDVANTIYYTYSNLSRDVLSANLDRDPLYTGTNPETEWVRFERGIKSLPVNKSLSMRLITVRANNYSKEYSDVSVYHLGIQPSPVVATPDSGTFGQPVDVTLSCSTPGAQIFYTTDNTDPRENGIPYTTYLTFNKDTSLRAVAYYQGQWSEVKSWWYIIDIVDEYGVEAFYPSGVYEGSVTVTLTPVNPENRIEYSTDGGTTWKNYTEPLEVDKNTEILAKSIDRNGNTGEEPYRFTYVIKPAPPVFAPESTQFTNANKVTIYCDESRNDALVQNYQRYDLFYTLDGSDPSDANNSQRKKAEAVSDAAVIDINGYTVVKAVVLLDGSTYSTIVTHSYDIVKNQPVAPMTTLPAGHYTAEIGGNKYTTQFVPVPTHTTIYYTISYGDEVKGDPFTNMDETLTYTPDTDIELKGRTVIKAVAVNAFNTRSDVGVFEYVIVPEAPKAAPSATIASELPVIPVDAVKGSTVTYTANGFTNSFVNADAERFYIDLKTGEAYRDEACTQRLGDPSNATNQDTVALAIHATLDGIDSLENRYVYTVSSNPDVLAPPYADKASGTYEEIKRDDDNTLLFVNLNSLNEGDTIQYMKNNNGRWEEYTGTLKFKEDVVLHIRSVKGTNVSAVESYTYEFVPLAPVITLESGRYSDNPVPVTKLALDSLAPADKTYTIFYRQNGNAEDRRYIGNYDIEIEHTMTLKAYVKNETTGKKSKNAINFYIIEPRSVESGTVYTTYPYEVYTGDTKYISSHLLNTSDYNKGIKLDKYSPEVPDAKIKYWYTYKWADGSGSATTETMTYDNVPVPVSTSMSELTIVAYLVDRDGAEIEGSQSTFNYVFVDLGIPDTSLVDTGKTEFPANTEYTLRHFEGEENKFIYYTLDGSDPSVPANSGRKLYRGETLKITENVTVKAVYYKVCGRCAECRNDEQYERLACTNAIYGEVGSYRYTVPTVVIQGGGGGGGGGRVTVDNTRKYTKDIFGNEHPTHIGYIKGYPDGSVRPNGFITREEMTAILYRITNHEYEKPFAVTGDVFPDVKADRWSVMEIEYMSDKKVVNGYPDGEFKPAGNLTRAEFASLIFRFTDIAEAKGANPFNDIAEEHWAYDDVIALVKAGLMQGYEDGSFKPENNITRAEVMTVVNKILGRKPLDSYIRSLNFNPFNDLYDDKWYYITVLEATITHDYYLDDKEKYERLWENWK